MILTVRELNVADHDHVSGGFGPVGAVVGGVVGFVGAGGSALANGNSWGNALGSAAFGGFAGALMGASVEWLLSQAPFGERMLDSWEALLALLLGKPSVEVAVTHIL